MIKISIDGKVMQSVMSGVADQIKSKIDLNQVKKLCKKQYGIETIGGIEYKDANVVVIENKIACKLDLEVRFPMSILISTRENSNNTLSENNYIPEEFDDLMEELDIPEDFDDVLEDFDDIPEELDEIPDELDIAEDLDEMLGEELGDKVRLKEQSMIGKDNKKP